MDALVDELQTEVGEALRTVATYDSGGYEIHHIRDDVDTEYSEEEIDAIYRQVEIEGMGYDYFEQLFHTGEFGHAVYGFETALMIQLPGGVFTGLFVTVDNDDDVDPDSIVRTCATAID